jgi:ABC-type nickel/cobalt efflux system permease component RcnA
MFFRAITGRGCAHQAQHDHTHDHAHDHGAGGDHAGGVAALDSKLIVATGLTPCASAIIILLFALANGALGIGIAAVSALSIGMAITVSAIGVASVLGRHAILRVVDGVGIASHRIEQGLAVLGALAIVTASGLMMFDAWIRL